MSKHNSDFSYAQYDQLDWQNQESTRLNAYVNEYIIRELLLKQEGLAIRIFDIGFGIGFFWDQLNEALPQRFEQIVLKGCEPSAKNYNHFVARQWKPKSNITAETFNLPFKDVQLEEQFDFLTAVYVFPHFSAEQLIQLAGKMHSMLVEGGQLVFVVTGEEYLMQDLKANPQRLIGMRSFVYQECVYQEYVHHSVIPQIGAIVDLDRDDAFFLHLFQAAGFKLRSQAPVDNNGFTCTVFAFEKQGDV